MLLGIFFLLREILGREFFLLGYYEGDCNTPACFLAPVLLNAVKAGVRLQ